MRTLWLAVIGCMVGLSVGLPKSADLALRVLADTDLDLKDFYKALGSHDFKKAGDLYDRMTSNAKKLNRESNKIGALRSKRGLATERFMRLAEVQMEVLVERLAAIMYDENDGTVSEPPPNGKKPARSESAPEGEKKSQSGVYYN